MSERYCTLLDVLPPAPSGTQAMSLVKKAKTRLVESGRTTISGDEVAFVAFLARMEEVMDKAVQMVVDEKFTVRFHGNPDQIFSDLSCYEIIPLGIDEKSV